MVRLNEALSTAMGTTKVLTAALLWIVAANLDIAVVSSTFLASFKVALVDIDSQRKHVLGLLPFKSRSIKYMVLFNTLIRLLVYDRSVILLWHQSDTSCAFYAIALDL